MHVTDDVESEYASHSYIIENVDGTFANYGSALKDIIGVSRQQENDSCTTFEIPFVDVDMPAHFGTSTDSTFCQGSDAPSDFSGYYSSLNCYQGIDARPVVTDSSAYLPNGVCPEFWKNEETTRNVKVEKMEFLTDTANMIGGMHLNTGGSVPF
ncbi:unnamed protein product [Lathyrus sativus]|nr:unnamed protein product [Lathyrus sativus]